MTNKFSKLSLTQLPLDLVKNRYTVAVTMFRFDNTLDSLRSIGFWEAISSILLFGVAMPMKYIWGEDMLIRPIGMAHGLLWMG